MFRSTHLSALALALLLPAAAPLSAQEDPPGSAEVPSVRKLPRQKLSGPRFGITVFTGEVADQRQRAGLRPFMTQFGWQAETRIVSTSDGGQALMEWIVLVGGIEQSEFQTLSVAWITGYRRANGMEFGVGPNLSVSSDGPTTSLVVAGGATLPVGELYAPLNLAVAFADGGPRITLLLGWIVG